jgi:hypothetical protein
VHARRSHIADRPPISRRRPGPAPTSPLTLHTRPHARIIRPPSLTSPVARTHNPAPHFPARHPPHRLAILPPRPCFCSEHRRRDRPHLHPRRGDPPLARRVAAGRHRPARPPAARPAMVTDARGIKPRATSTACSTSSAPPGAGRPGDLEFTLLDLRPGEPVPHGFSPLGDPTGHLLHTFARARELVLVVVPQLFKVPSLLLGNVARELGRLGLWQQPTTPPSPSSTARSPPSSPASPSAWAPGSPTAPTCSTTPAAAAAAASTSAASAPPSPCPRPATPSPSTPSARASAAATPPSPREHPGRRPQGQLGRLRPAPRRPPRRPQRRRPARLTWSRHGHAQQRVVGSRRPSRPRAQVDGTKSARFAWATVVISHSVRPCPRCSSTNAIELVAVELLEHPDVALGEEGLPAIVKPPAEQRVLGAALVVVHPHRDRCDQCSDAAGR